MASLHLYIEDIQMEAALFIYLLSILDNVQVPLGIAVAILMTCSLFNSIFALDSSDEDEAARHKVMLKKNIKWIIGLSAFLTFVPSKETAVFMAGGYGVQTIAESIGKNEEVKRVASKSVEAVERYLDSVAEKPKK